MSSKVWLRRHMALVLSGGTEKQEWPTLDEIWCSAISRASSSWPTNCNKSGFLQGWCQRRVRATLPCMGLSESMFSCEAQTLAFKLREAANYGRLTCGGLWIQLRQRDAMARRYLLESESGISMTHMSQVHHWHVLWSKGFTRTKNLKKLYDVTITNSMIDIC